jgi:hypothetical protein
MNTTKATVEEIDEELMKLGQKRDQIKAEMLDLTRVRDEKAALEAAEQRVATMSDPERAALLQTLQAGGIESDHKMGTPGS